MTRAPSENLRFFSIFPNFTISNADEHACEHDTKQVTVSNFEQTNTLLPRRQHYLSYEPLSGSNGFTLSRIITRTVFLGQISIFLLVTYM